MPFYRSAICQPMTNFSEYELNGANCLNYGSEWQQDYDIASFNLPVIIGSRITNCSNMFKECTSFNQPVSIPSGESMNLAYMFTNCYSFNQPITIPNNAYAHQMFYRANSFNQPINIPDNVSMASFLHLATQFNASVSIGENVRGMASSFRNCTHFNQPVSFPQNASENCSMAYCFDACSIFNQPVNIPNGVSNCAYALMNCDLFNQNVIVPASVNDMTRLLWNSLEWGANLFIKGTVERTIKVSELFGDVFGSYVRINMQKVKNVFFNSALDTTMRNINAGVTMTWTNMSDGNGFYNTQYNIYCYNNYAG